MQQVRRLAQSETKRDLSQADHIVKRKQVSALSEKSGGMTMKYVCDVCGWEYDEEAGYPEGGIAPGTKWEDVPEDFECPLCGVGKDQFSEE